MSQRPTIDPAVVTTLTDAAPQRIQKKLETDPKLADTWNWTIGTDQIVINTGPEFVTLSAGKEGSIGVPEAVSCSCLLSPRCLHVLAVIHALPLKLSDVDGPPELTSDTDANGAQATTPTQDEESVTQQIDEEARAAAKTMLRAGGRMLERGAANASLTASTELLRAVHSCRIHSLHRLAAAGLRVAESVRMYRENSVDFDRDRLVLEFRELVSVAHALSQPETDATLYVGTARRKYRDVGSKKLSGVLVDPIITKTGYAGTVTYLMDPDGVMWTLSDVAPGHSSRAIGAYDGGVSIGDVKSAPRVICRGGLLLQGATGSQDGRLGSGKAVRAVSVKGTSPHEWPVWSLPFEAQVANSLAASASLQRRAGDDLLFFEATIAGVSGENLIVFERRSQRQVRIKPPSISAGLRFVSNLQMLGRASGMTVRLAVRRSDDARDGYDALAVFPAPDSENTIDLPDALDGRINLGLDPIQPEFIGAFATRPIEVLELEAPQDPLHVLRQRVASVVQGGRFVFHAGASHAVHRDANRLNAQLMPHAANLLSELLEQAQYAERDLSGRMDQTDPERFAITWCAAATYLNAAEVELARAGAI